MTIFGIFNTKGGVGKSTVTTSLADFFASNLRIGNKRNNKNVLVIDLDRQGSVSNALLGKELANRVRSNQKTVSHLAWKLVCREEADPLHYAIPRALEDYSGKRIRLRELKVMIPDDDMIDHFNEKVRKEHLPTLVKQFKGALKQSHFEAIFIDFPAGVSRQDLLSLTGIAMCDYIVIPTEVTELALDALPRTFRMLDTAHAMAAPKTFTKPKLLGILPTKANATHSQFKRHFNGLKKFATANGTTLFQKHVPNSPSLANATDDTIKHIYIKERYGSAYDQARHVALELAKRAGWE